MVLTNDTTKLTFGSNRGYRHVLIVLIVLLVACLIAIIVLAVQLNKAQSDDDNGKVNTDSKDNLVTGCDDIAIVGAGVGGSYSAWKLRNRHQVVTVYEYSDRIGGRLHTTQIKGVPDINVELGEHQLLNSTIHELGLTVFDHTPTYAKHPCVYVRGMNLKLRNVSGLSSLFNIKQDEMIPVSQLRWEIFVNNTDYLTNNDKKAEYLKTKDGIYLYKQSLDSVYTKYVRTELREYIKSLTPWQIKDGDASCLIGFPDNIGEGNSNATIHIKTVKEGFEEIPKRLMEKFLKTSSDHAIVMNRDLTGISKQEDGSFVLKFTLTTTEKGITRKTTATEQKCAHKVILATDRISLEKLDWVGLSSDRIQNIILNSVYDVKVAKIFLAYEIAWWNQTENNCDHVNSDTPLKETLDYGTSNHGNASVLLVGYTDSANLWNELNSRGISIEGTDLISVMITNETVFAINKLLAQMFNIDDVNIPSPIAGVIGMWNSYPYGGGWQVLKPGYIYSEIKEEIVKPSAHDDVFIASNAFNVNTWWAEGAMESVERVFSKMNA